MPRYITAQKHAHTCKHIHT